MIKIRSFFILFSFVFFLLGCESRDITIEWLNDREYIIVVADEKSNVFLQVSIEYVGKTPFGTEENPPENTDFYTVIFENYSTKPVMIKEIRYALEIGSLYSAKVKHMDEIEVTYGTSVIEAKTILTRKNANVWAKDDNQLHREFVLSYEGKEYLINVPLVFKR